MCCIIIIIVKYDGYQHHFYLFTSFVAPQFLPLTTVIKFHSPLPPKGPPYLP